MSAYLRQVSTKPSLCIHLSSIADFQDDNNGVVGHVRLGSPRMLAFSGHLLPTPLPLDEFFNLGSQVEQLWYGCGVVRVIERSL